MSREPIRVMVTECEDEHGRFMEARLALSAKTYFPSAGRGLSATTATQYTTDLLLRHIDKFFAAYVDQDVLREINYRLLSSSHDGRGGHLVTALRDMLQLPFSVERDVDGSKWRLVSLQNENAILRARINTLRMKGRTFKKGNKKRKR